MAARHERGLFLVADLNEFDVIAGATERRYDAVDAVAGIAKDAAYLPLAEPLEQEIPNRLRHLRLPDRGALENGSMRKAVP